MPKKEGGHKQCKKEVKVQKEAIGKAKIGLLLALLRQGILFVPLILILPLFFGEIGVWISFPISDLLATAITALILLREIKKRLV